MPDRSADVCNARDAPLLSSKLCISCSAMRLRSPSWRYCQGQPHARSVLAHRFQLLHVMLHGLGVDLQLLVAERIALAGDPLALRIVSVGPIGEPTYVGDPATPRARAEPDGHACSVSEWRNRWRRTDANAEREQGHENQHEALATSARVGRRRRRRTKTTELMQVAPSEAVQLSALVGVETAPVAVAPLLATVIVCVTVSVAVDMAPSSCVTEPPTLMCDRAMIAARMGRRSGEARDEVPSRARQSARSLVASRVTSGHRHDNGAHAQRGSGR